MNWRAAGGVVGLLVLAVALAIAWRPEQRVSSDADTSSSPAGNASPANLDQAIQAADRIFETPPASACAEAELGEPVAPELNVDAEMREKVGERLAVSRSSEHLLAVALLAEQPAQRLEAIRSALVTAGNDPVVAWTAVQMCAAAPPDVQCPATEWESRLLSLDSQNSEAWVRVAASRFRRGDRKSALEALERSAAVSITKVYWTETIAMLERALESAGGYSFPERASIAFGLAAANQPDYQAYLAMCRSEASSSAEWAAACLNYGRLAERESKTNLGKAMAREIQIVALEAIGDRDELAQVQTRKEHAARNVAITPERVRAETAIASSPALFATYLDALNRHGEEAAIERVQEEMPTPNLQCVR